MKEEVKMTTTHVHEYLVDNGSPEPYDEESNNAYKRNDILNAMKVRETEYLLACWNVPRIAVIVLPLPLVLLLRMQALLFPTIALLRPRNKPFSLSDL